MNNKTLLKRLIHFNNSEVDLIKGSKSNDIESILGYRGKDEVVHRDDLVLKKIRVKMKARIFLNI